MGQPQRIVAQARENLIEVQKKRIEFLESLLNDLLDEVIGCEMCGHSWDTTQRALGRSEEDMKAIKHKKWPDHYAYKP
jgi:hypothetical protein